MKDRLGLDRCVLFRSACFGRWLDLTYVENEEDLIHYMLQKQKVYDNDHYDLPLIYNVNGHTLHFGRHEFCLITGFKFGFNSFRKFREGDISFRDRVFPEKIEEVCLLSSLEVIFMGHELGYAVDDVFLRMVDNLEAWNVFPWGEHIWRELYTAIRNVNSKHKDVHHKALEINPKFVSSCSLSGFVLCFKAKKPNYDLYPNRVEAQSEWFTKSNDFFKWYTPRAPPVEYGGLFGDYLKKLSSARTLREKDREAWSEMKSLKARVYKLETIINVITPKTKATNVKHKVNTVGTKDKVESVGKQCDLGDKCWSDQDDAFDDLLDANAKLEEVDKDLSQLKSKRQSRRDSALAGVICKFPRGNDVVVDRTLSGHCLNWASQSCQDWSMVSCNFLTLLLRESMPLFYATDEIYPLAWRDVKQIRRCLESKLPVVLQETSVFVRKGIYPTHYNIKFRHAQNVPKQGGVFGNCGIFVCLFLYRLAHGILLDVEDPIQTALAYREKNYQFLFRPQDHLSILVFI
ncbi:hypothetical protein Tco_0577875 [Tanacetum coccineum]